HGVHAVLANKQNIFHYDAPLPVCETASIFSELLVNERMKKEKPKLAKQILLTQIDDFYASIMRQAWFVIFEETAHDMVAEHPSVDMMAATYKKQLQEQFGNALEVPDVFAYEFLYIPHIFHTPFYCYAYSFGNLLSLALFAQYKKNPAFAGKIVAFLAKGGSESPAKMVKTLGFDLADENFWQGGFDVIKKMIKEL
ncbi:M3 family oligoendopeptidase, partial [Candidatus Woesearchaeota archaeon]|nr:M3 family oligoendopeptidase [Candidatus Woesearchaeota archaeon]